MMGYYMLVKKKTIFIHYLKQSLFFVPKLLQGVLARGGDVLAASEVECVEIRTS